jgi:predicted TIM-barrel fold metal-dependent hydrolase
MSTITTIPSGPIFDADEHYYEPLDAFARHLPPEWRERTVQEVKVGDRVRFMVGGKLNLMVNNPTFDPIVKAGAMSSYFRGNPEKKTLADCLAEREPIPACYRNRDARIEKMDQQQVQFTWLLPTIGMLYEEDLQYDPEAAGVAFRAFNRWLLEDWGFDYKNRIFAAPYLAMGDREAAVEEVEFGLKNGARIFVVRPTGVYSEGRWCSPGDPLFDSIWARVAEAGATVVPHIGSVGYSGLDRFLPKTTKGFIGTEPPALQVAIGHDRPIANYLSALVCDKLFERFPALHVASVENGADFLPLTLNGLRRAGFQRRGYFADDPVEIFKRNIWVAPFWEDDLGEAAHLIGADRVLFGSDWPHPEGIAEPREYWHKVVSEIGDLKAGRKIMFENAALLTRVNA